MDDKGPVSVRKRMDAEGVLERWLVGRHPLMEALRGHVRRHARGVLPVLIEGLPGTGKERVARALHALSHRSDRPFIAISLPATSEALVESDLFGHEEGAFTGALARRIGCLERAAEGTAFFDEIADASPYFQVKLLRAMDPGEFTRVGGNEVLFTKARIVAATNTSPEALRRTGRLREDFLGRIGAIRIRVPALRDRLSDLPKLAAAILEENHSKTGHPARRVSDAGLRILERQEWPSNIRDLRNVLLQCTSWVEKEEVGASDIEFALNDRCGEEPLLAKPSHEADRLRDALRQEGGVVVRAMRRLGMGHTVFYEKLAKHGIDPNDFRTGRTCPDESVRPGHSRDPLDPRPTDEETGTN